MLSARALSAGKFPKKLPHSSALFYFWLVASLLVQRYLRAQSNLKESAEVYMAGPLNNFNSTQLGAPGDGFAAPELGRWAS